MKNKLIVIEGCDCVGKTTMIKDLKEEIKKRNPNAKILALSLPYRNRACYTKIREVLGGKSSYPADVVQSLFVVNLIDTAERDINPFLLESEEDRYVILDRSLISTILYNAMASGSLFDSILTYMNKLRIAGVKEIPEDPTVVDLDIINKMYGHLAVSVNFTFFLMPPLQVVLNRSAAKEKETGESNDNKAMVQRMYNAYLSFYSFISGSMYRSVVDLLESPKGVLKPQVRDLNKYILLSEWNDKISEEENHKIYREAILAKLEL